jgi:hypothetical protein
MYGTTLHCTYAHDLLALSLEKPAPSVSIKCSLVLPLVDMANPQSAFNGWCEKQLCEIDCRQMEESTRNECGTQSKTGSTDRSYVDCTQTATIGLQVCSVMGTEVWSRDRNNQQRREARNSRLLLLLKLRLPNEVSTFRTFRTCLGTLSQTNATSGR